MIFLLVFFCALGSPVSAAAEAERVLRIGIPGEDIFFVQQGQWVIEAADQLGYRIEFVSLPPARSLLMAARGDIDGDLLRQPLALKGYHSLIPVQVPLIKLDYWFHQLADRRCPTSERELKNLKPVGVLGLKYFDLIYNMSDVGFEQVADYGAAIKMLKAGRAGYLAALKHPRTQIWAERFGTPLKVCLPRPVLSLEGYLILHEKHKDLIPQLETALASVIEAHKDGQAWRLR